MIVLDRGPAPYRFSAQVFKACWLSFGNKSFDFTSFIGFQIDELTFEPVCPELRGQPCVLRLILFR